MHGETMLVIGSYAGPLCSEALNRGASSATGIDANRERIRQAVECTRTMEKPPEYIYGSWEDGCFNDRRFDHVVCDETLEAMNEPIGALQRMMKCARQRVILQLNHLTLNHFHSRIFDSLFLLGRRQPKITLIPPQTAGRTIVQKFVFTPAAMRILFNAHSTAYEPIKILSSRNTFIVEAKRRRIENLVVVAGPTSSGKSVLTRRLAADDSMRSQLGLHGQWKIVRGRDVAMLPSGDLGNILLEIDLMIVGKGDLGAFDSIPLFEILKTSSNLRIITIVPWPRRGRLHMKTKEVNRLQRKCGQLGISLVDFYRGNDDGRLVRELYRNWFEWVGRQGARAHALAVNDLSEFRWEPLHRFEELFDSALQIVRRN
jgi:hypothetical protein